MEHHWVQGREGLVAARLDAEVPDARWDRPGRECGLVQLWLDGVYHQDVILVRGEERGTYERLLGRVPPGPHVLAARPAPTAAPSRPTARLHALGAVPLEARDALEALAWEQAPVLYTRGRADPWEGLWTDTPLALFYRPVGDGVEYQCIFSHEDGGTSTRGLLARWGRTTDIEWILRVPREGTPTYQGPWHRTRRHRGRRALGRLAVDAVGRHGMVSDRRQGGAMRCLFLPRVRWDPEVPRESCLEGWMYRVAALELDRQGRLFPGVPPKDPRPADMRDYLFVQVRRRDDGVAGVALAVEVRTAEGRYLSSGGDPRMAVARPGAWAAAVKLPPGAAVREIAVVPVRAFPAGRIGLALHRAFRLGPDLQPAPGGWGPGPEVALGPGQRGVTLWREA